MKTIQNARTKHTHTKVDVTRCRSLSATSASPVPVQCTKRRKHHHHHRQPYNHRNIFSTRLGVVVLAASMIWIDVVNIEWSLVQSVPALVVDGRWRASAAGCVVASVRQMRCCSHGIVTARRPTAAAAAAARVRCVGGMTVFWKYMVL